MKPVNVQPEARADLADADEWYEQRLPGLGDRFLNSFRKTTQRIAEFPDGFTRIDAGAHRAMIRGFPYHVIYQVEESSIEVVAVIHAHRNPDVWKERLG